MTHADLWIYQTLLICMCEWEFYHYSIKFKTNWHDGGDHYDSQRTEKLDEGIRIAVKNQKSSILLTVWPVHFKIQYNSRLKVS